jgi:signal transduction histidine kinase
MLRKRYIIWIGLCAIVAPLLVNLYTQYRSLTELQRISPLVREESWERRLNEVASDIQQYYRMRAYHALDVPTSAILPNSRDDDVETSFADAPAEGVKRYFISSPSAKPGLVKVTLYDPVARTKVTERSPDHWAAFSASSAYFSLILRDAPVDPSKLVFGEDDPDNRIIAMPICDENSHAVGVAGMIVDTDYFKNVLLPERLPEALSRHFSEAELEQMSISISDDSNAIVRETHETPEAEEPKIQVPLQLAFSRWHLGATSTGRSQEQLASDNFRMNFSLTVLNTLALALGLGLAFRAASKELKISEMKSDFVSNVSHELRTPLASISMLGEFLRSGRGVDPEKLRKYGEYIETESQRLAKLINNILDFSKIESGQREYDFRPYHVEQIVADVLRLFEVRLGQHGFAADVEIVAPPLPAVTVDPDAVTQALSNLVDNAVKYSGDSRELRIRAWHENGAVFVSVTDFGLGIPRDEQQKIFERFHRVSTGLVHNVKGSGLGLALVKHIAEAHGGLVTVSSELGRGSTFTLQFPARTDVHTVVEDGSIFPHEALRFDSGK